MAKRAIIKELSLTNLTSFTDNTIAFSEGINVIIGENSTGKTHLMKILHCLLKANEEIIDKQATSIENREVEIAHALKEYFKPDELGRLVTRGRGVKTTNVRMNIGTGNYEKKVVFSFSSRASKKVNLEEYTLSEIPFDELPDSVYIPPVEMLTISEGFIGAYDNRETAYDKTYYDLAKALEPLPVRGPKLKEVNAMIQPIESATHIKVTKENNKFYLTFDSRGKMEAPLVAEGMKKLGMLIYLINNGSLSNNSILFWDEPEAHLNPKYLGVVVDLLSILAKRGVQIFVATHDYILSQRLSLLAEERESASLKDKKKLADVKFISLYFEEDLLKAEVVNSLSEAEHNPILREFANYADLEDKFYLDKYKDHA